MELKNQSVVMVGDEVLAIFGDFEDAKDYVHKCGASLPAVIVDMDATVFLNQELVRFLTRSNTRKVWVIVSYRKENMQELKLCGVFLSKTQCQVCVEEMRERLDSSYIYEMHETDPTEIPS